MEILEVVQEAVGDGESGKKAFYHRREGKEGRQLGMM